MDHFLTGRENLEGKEGSTPVAGASAGGISTLQPIGQTGSSEDVTVAEDQGNGEMPKVEVVSEKGMVRRIRVTCTCGKCMELDCEY